MEYVIGIDGGGTKTRFILADMQGRSLATAEGGPANINSSGEAQVRAVLEKGLLEVLHLAGVDPAGCRMVVLGSAGAGRPEEKKILEKILKNIGFQDRVMVTDDVVAALYGGVGKGEGIILISGTGSICYGRNSRGDSHRAGGWGHILGDEGSAYDIGRRILCHVMRSYDGREKEGLLRGLVMEHLRMRSPEELVGYVYRSGIGKKEIADLAPLADQARKVGDKKAEEILKAAASELFACVKAVAERVAFSCESVPLVLSGGVLQSSQFVREELSHLVEVHFPFVSVEERMIDPAWGAVLMALECIFSKKQD